MLPRVHAVLVLAIGLCLPPPSLSRAATPGEVLLAAPPPRVLVVSYSDRAAVHGVAFPLLRAYCRHHGYAHRLLTSDAAFRRLGGPARAAPWRKVELLIDAIEDAVAAATFDLVVWVDDDIMVVDASQSLGGLADRFGLWPPLAHSPTPPLILCGSDSYYVLSRSTGAQNSHPFNSGLLMARVDEKTAALLRLVWDAAPVLAPRSLQHPVFEQDVFTLLWPALRRTVAIAARRAMQSLSSNYLPGDFAFHTAGMATAQRSARLGDLAARCGAGELQALGLCSAAGFGGGARFASSPDMLLALVGAQLGRSVAAVGTPTAGVHVLAVVVDNLRPAVLYIVPEDGAGADLAAVADAYADAPLTVTLIGRLDELALNASRRAAVADGAAFFAAWHPGRSLKSLVFSRVAGAAGLEAAASAAAVAEAEAAAAAANASTAADAAGPLEDAVAVATKDAEVEGATHVPTRTPMVGAGGGGGFAAVLLFAPHHAPEAEATRLRTRLAEAAPLVRPASGVICVLSTRSEERGLAGACSRAALSRAEMLAALQGGVTGANGSASGDFAFRVAGVSMPWAWGEGEGGDDAAFFDAAREGGGSPIETWATGGAAEREAGRIAWDCPAVCFASEARRRGEAIEIA